MKNAINFIIFLQVILGNSGFHAGDYDSNIPGVYGEPSFASDESSREIIPLLTRLIKVIEDNGPLPDWAVNLQQAMGAGAGMPGAVPLTGGTFAPGIGTQPIAMQPGSVQGIGGQMLTPAGSMLQRSSDFQAVPGTYMKNFWIIISYQIPCALDPGSIRRGRK